jgi:hypothetical protein
MADTDRALFASSGRDRIADGAGHRGRGGAVVPDFLDTFALIGTLIGVTSRIRVMTDVANLPLRRDSGELVDEYLAHAGRVLSRGEGRKGRPRQAPRAVRTLTTAQAARRAR